MWQSDITLPADMKAVVTLGEGGYEQLSYRTAPLPRPQPGYVLLRVGAAGVNNTDINTRLGWYSRAVTDATSETTDQQAAKDGQGGWAGSTPFPLIQGTDCCGEIVAVCEVDYRPLLGQRALIRACMRPNGFARLEMSWMASNFDGAFADYVAVPAHEVFPVKSNWQDAELATIPCAYATAETMLERARCQTGDVVLITGASGGVGSAAIQLAKRRGATIIALTSPEKKQDIIALGCDEVYDRDCNLEEVLGTGRVDIAIDNVAGPRFPQILTSLKAGGRYASSGAIAGPIVQLDMRDLYLKDITMLGSTAWDEAVFPNLIRYIEGDEIKPLLAATYPLSEIVAAQQFFEKKSHIGNVVLIPDNRSTT